MPPRSPIPNENEDRLLHPAPQSGAGALVGIIIILLLLIGGAFYSLNARLNAQNNRDQLPLIPASYSTTTILSTTTLVR